MIQISSKLAELQAELASAEAELGAAEQKRQKVLTEMGSLIRVAQNEMIPNSRELLSRSVYDLGLSVRALNCLAAERINYIGELVRYTEDSLLRTPNIGRRTCNEIKEALESRGLRLGMEPKDWVPPP